ncbi:M48 family metalloprotease [Aureimonas psammosilenae]|uniref:hypothetical protein n=1 Tax=Aureimonas psammosilenae TaxID=2495496 RepID=UPI0012611CA5|nr:hypothetical protein [Aureimonas psammosilenae]
MSNQSNTITIKAEGPNAVRNSRVLHIFNQMNWSVKNTYEEDYEITLLINEEESSVQASVTLAENPVVEISQGLIDSLAAYFQVDMNTKQEILGETIADGAPIKGSFNSASANFLEAFLGLNLGEILSREQTEIIKKRCSLGNLLFDNAIFFVLAHEVAHVIQGHTAYLRNQHNFALLKMTDVFHSENDITRIIQALELDADIVAFKNMLNRKVAVDFPIVLNNWNGYFKADVTDLAFESYAVYTAFRMLYQYSPDDLVDSNLLDHPPLLFRMFTSAGAAMFFQLPVKYGAFSCNLEHQMELCRRILQSAEDSFCGITFLDRDLSLLPKFNDEFLVTSQRFVQETLRNLEHLDSELKQYRWKPKLNE